MLLFSCHRFFNSSLSLLATSNSPCVDFPNAKIQKLKDTIIEKRKNRKTQKLKNAKIGKYKNYTAIINGRPYLVSLLVLRRFFGTLHKSHGGVSRPSWEVSSAIYTLRCTFSICSVCSEILSREIRASTSRILFLIGSATEMSSVASTRRI